MNVTPVEPTVEAACADAAELARALQERAGAAILSGTHWLTATEVSDHLQPHLPRLLGDQRLFAIAHEGSNLFPGYAFDAAGDPVPEMLDILETFRDYSPLRIAGWFESTSSTLGGKRPREVLLENPRAVIAAARDHAAGVQHG